MTSHSSRRGPGLVALVGSGEYLDVMNEVDSYLLNTVGGVSSAKVALLPTASGLEPNGPTSWNNLGVRHFKNLGVNDVRATRIIDRASAFDQEQLALLQGADFYYFSGGNPQHTIETLYDSPAWQHIKAAYDQGAVLAGCSAGAMMLSSYTISVRQVMLGEPITFVKSMGIVPNIIVFPHFDRMAGFLDQDRFQHLLHAVPEKNTVVGIDEDTALVRIESNNGPDLSARWKVMGRQTVSVFDGGKPPYVLHAGDEITL
ncbi:MAG: cyanophycinase [Ktedonobacteraceae bacterium]